MKIHYQLLLGLIFSILVSCNPPVSKTKSGAASDIGDSVSEKGKSSLDSASKSSAVEDSVKLDQNQLVGNWVRTDGGYELEILSATADGKLEAGYFNPNPIHVGLAEWLIKNNSLVITVELQDKNYPGSTYTLEFLPSKDRLVGNYFQAVEGVNFDVEFTRLK
jgi:hypothetical protein